MHDRDTPTMDAESAALVSLLRELIGEPTSIAENCALKLCDKHEQIWRIACATEGGIHAIAKDLEAVQDAIGRQSERLHGVLSARSEGLQGGDA